MNILIINGVNLNMLGKREPTIYGKESLEDINKFISDSFPNDNIEFFQSNYEGAIVEKIQQTECRYLLINAGAYTHYSIAIHDAISSRDDLVCVEIHISDPKKRESFRHISYIEDVSEVTFAGFGKHSYTKGVKYIKDKYDRV